jgi:hypothetical protein
MPSELWQVIFERLDIESLFACNQVSITVDFLFGARDGSGNRTENLIFCDFYANGLGESPVSQSYQRQQGEHLVGLLYLNITYLRGVLTY